ncbi:MAG: ferritin [Candidatus Altiarchaeota archaeon]
MIDKKIEDGFNSQINAELYSAYLYLSMAAYFESENFKGFGKWMREQSLEESKHAMKFYDHIMERGGKVTLKPIEGPKTEWKSPLDAFEDAYSHEQKVTAMINGLVELTASEKDNPGNSMLQWFVDEQVEEERNAREIVAFLKRIKDAGGALMMIDHRLGKRGQKKE